MIYTIEKLEIEPHYRSEEVVYYDASEPPPILYTHRYKYHAWIKGNRGTGWNLDTALEDAVKLAKLHEEAK